MLRRKGLTGVVCLAALICAANASMAAAEDWNLSPLEYSFDDLVLRVGGHASGALFVRSQPAAPNLDLFGPTGAGFLTTAIDRDYDNGLSISLKSVLELYHDHLSGDIYGNKFLQKLYVNVQTGLGRFEIGQTDGASYTLSVTGPVVDDDVSLDANKTTFFADPLSNKAFTGVFTARSAVQSSSNYPKLSYYTPRLFGIQLALSYTPSESREVLPFVSNGPHLADRQRNIWEFVGSYSDNLGPVAVGAYGSLMVAHDASPTPFHKGLTEWGGGVQADYGLTEDISLSVGGGYRLSNAYAFDIYSVLSSGTTRATHLSATVTDGPWLAGFEYTDGKADGGTLKPSLAEKGYQASVGYVINANLQLTAGWERLDYDRSAGVFYSGLPHTQMDAGFLHLKLHV